MIRTIVIGVPLFFAFLITASFLNELTLASKKKNEMIISLAGDPQNFNPIQSTDTTSSAISGNIFDGLLKYDENLELAPELAQSWTISQTSTFFFTTPTAAAHALATLKANSAKWPLLHIIHASLQNRCVIVSLSVPGYSDSNAIASLISPLPITVFRANLTTASARKALAAARTAAATQTFASSLLPEKNWYDYDAAYEATIVGPFAPAFGELISFHSSQGRFPASVEVVNTGHFIAEPQIDFELRRNVKWQDGAPFSARDVTFTFRSIMDENVHSPRKADFDKVFTVEALNPYHVRITYRGLYSPALASWTMGVLPAHILEGKPASWWAVNFNRQPIGTGPFKFEEWKTNEYVRLSKNPLYFDVPPWLDGITYRIIPDALTQRLAFETRQVDFLQVDPWSVKSNQKNPNYQLYSTPGGAYGYIGWNLRNPIFQDPRVRTALAHAVNIPAVVHFILYGQAIQSTGIFPPNAWYFNPKVQPYPFDPAKATALLEEAGWKKGPNGMRFKDGKPLSFTLLTPSNQEIRKDIATLVQDDLRKIGVDTKIENYEWSVFLSQHILKLDFDAVVLGWAGGGYDQYQIWSSTQTKPGLLNFVGYSNPKVDQLLEQIRQEYDRRTIIRLAGELQSTIYHDQPYLFLFVPNETTAVWKNAFRVYRPDGRGRYIDTPIIPPKAGWSYYSKWFYRPEYASRLPRPVQNPPPL
ncbi:MAG: hypothetical protein C5B47_08745 [Verrucomicrobia bacterium]|nr:MAG: hypothetical protein C5B47_08745 [Verrucomicrobiota bacterium]